MNCSSAQRAFRRIRVLLPVLGLLGVLLSVPRTARANSGKSSFLETIGISIAVGTVLGASTLPFYDQPATHAINLAYGASAGAVTGIGILVYQLLAGPSQDGFEDARQLWQPGSEAYAQSRKGSFTPSRATAADATNAHRLIHFESNPGAGARTIPVYPAQFWMPVVSLNW